jgi:hypothetical protein
MPPTLYRFAECLRGLLACADPAALEDLWEAEGVEDLGWAALERAGVSTDPALVPVLDEADGLLLRLLDRLPGLARRQAAGHLATFRIPALERLQHATAAALVAHRLGPAGLATMVADAGAPLPRRYHAFLTLARLHATTTWPLFHKYLIPGAHHAFVGVAAEAARFYPDRRPAPGLVVLFEAVRNDLHLRAFLSPRILESLYVLCDRRTLGLYADLLVTGHTSPDPERCEVTHALVMVRRFTGGVAPSAKFADPDEPGVRDWLDRAERRFDRSSAELHPAVVLGGG